MEADPSIELDKISTQARTFRQLVFREILNSIIETKTLDGAVGIESSESKAILSKKKQS